MTEHAVSVVTGASSGVGRAMTLTLAARGGRVFATVRTEADADALRDVATADGLLIDPVIVDLTDGAAVDLAFDEIWSRTDYVDHLVSNAGVYIGGAIENVPIEDVQRAIEVNYVGALRTAKAVIPRMRARGRGHIVAVSSQSARYVLPTGGVYSASKAALEAALEALALEVGRHGVHVSIVELGLVRTRIHANATRHSATEAYVDTYRRALAVGLADTPLQLEPDAVATEIAQLLTTSTPPFRVTVGPDAARNLMRRAALTDEEYVALHAIVDDEPFSRAWTDTFGFEIDL